MIVGDAFTANYPNPRLEHAPKNSTDRRDVRLDQSFITFTFNESEEVMSDATSATNNDPLQSVADAMQAAVDSARDGAIQAQEAAERVLPGIGRFASRFVYTTCYTISYGVVFPAALVAMSIPSNNSFVQGMIDGSHAARQKVGDILGHASDKAATEHH
jgi:hypothetical protein